jgi:hypothetical protein
MKLIFVCSALLATLWCCWQANDATASSALPQGGTEACGVLQPIFRNYDVLRTQPERFYEILNLARAQFQRCEEPGVRTCFLRLFSLSPRGAEFQEFLSETVETVLLKDPDCVLAPLEQLSGTQRTNVLKELVTPTFVDEGDVLKVFSKPHTRQRFPNSEREFFLLRKKVSHSN